MANDSNAVLFVECQNGLLGDNSVIRSIAEAARPVLPAMGRLAAGARTAGARVVHLTAVPVANDGSTNRRPPLFARLSVWLGSLGTSLKDGGQGSHPILLPGRAKRRRP